MLFIPSFLVGSNRKYKEDLVHHNKLLPSMADIFQVAVTFLFVTLAWIFFRSETVSGAFHYIGRILHNAKGKSLSLDNGELIGHIIAFVTFFTISAYFLYRKNQLITVTWLKQFSVSVILLVLITLLGQFSRQSFIYFQF